MIIKEIQADARHVVVLYEAAQFRDSQTVARGQYLGSDTFEIKINKYIYIYFNRFSGKAETERRSVFQIL